jgi:hypothetical protein
MAALDFKLYLDAANEASKRSRGYLYWLCAASLTFAVLLLNLVVLDWPGMRVERIRLLYHCASGIASKEACTKAYDYAETTVPYKQIFAGKYPCPSVSIARSNPALCALPAYGTSRRCR